MPYVMVRVLMSPIMGARRQVILDCSHGDGQYERDLMSRIAAAPNPNGNRSDCSYVVYDNPFAVLGNLEKFGGYKVVAANAARRSTNDEWQIWTLHREP